MSTSKGPDSRRDFLVMAATGAAAGFGAMLPVSAAANLPELPADTADWLDSIPGRHRQVTDWPDLNNGVGLIYTWSFLNTSLAGYGCQPSDLGCVLILRHDTIPIAMNDACGPSTNWVRCIASMIRKPMPRRCAILTTTSPARCRCRLRPCRSSWRQASRWWRAISPSPSGVV